MSSKIVLYGMDISPPVRACLLTLNALGLDFEYVVRDLSKMEHLSEDALKKNPQHTIPVLDDKGTWLWDSHAICSYLVGKYAKTDMLYSQDLLQKARIDQRLHFDSSVLFPALRFTVLPMWREGSKKVSKYQSSLIIEAYDHCEAFLADSKYMVGDRLTIADFSCVATVTSLKGIIDLDAQKYPKTLAWIERLSSLPYYEKSNAEGNNKYVEILKTMLTEIEM